MPTTLVFCTYPSQSEARKALKSILEKRLAACGNILPGVESHFWWNGRIEKNREVLLLLKTNSRKIKALTDEMERMHPYDKPVIEVLPARMNAKALPWLLKSLRLPRPKK